MTATPSDPRVDVDVRPLRRLGGKTNLRFRRSGIHGALRHLDGFLRMSAIFFGDLTGVFKLKQERKTEKQDPTFRGLVFKVLLEIGGDFDGFYRQLWDH